MVIDKSRLARVRVLFAAEERIEQAEVARALGAELYYDPEERAAEKQAARDKDDEDLAAGRVTREELLAKNAHFGRIRGRIKTLR